MMFVLQETEEEDADESLKEVGIYNQISMALNIRTGEGALSLLPQLKTPLPPSNSRLSISTWNNLCVFSRVCDKEYYILLIRV
jgi:hypothetical protein